MASDVRSILSLEVPIIVLLGERQMRTGDVVNLVPGAIIELPKSAEDELSLLVNNKPIGSGHAVKVGENFGLRISFIGDVRQRIHALGEAAAPAGAKAAESPADVVAADEPEPAQTEGNLAAAA
ncbi:MAG: FliM/FliN family flagellar motor switch protein [Phycisphaeraceae bacterium]|nr:FliM/FliN family flagellar motor switch protein [Phycisphaeraceae bacterium]MBX3407676.1 FliM/FliN family flagellar motor switch protein [Phycisphaeraceae bacterium]